MDDVERHGGIEGVMRAELTRGDRVLNARAAVLRQLISSDDRSMFTDAIVARVRAMAGDIASQLAVRLAEAAGEAQPERWTAVLGEPLAGALIDDAGILDHLHSIALEWQLTETLERRAALDPVVSPMLQALIAADDPATSELAMELLASQALFVRHQQRMALPLGDLPADVLERVLHMMRGAVGGDGLDGERARIAERAIRADHDETRARPALADRLSRALGAGAFAALSVTHGGVALFLSTLATLTGAARDVAAAATSESQLARLALSLRMAGLTEKEIEREFLALHPDITLPPAMARLKDDTARDLLTTHRGDDVGG